MKQEYYPGELWFTGTRYRMLTLMRLPTSPPPRPSTAPPVMLAGWALEVLCPELYFETWPCPISNVLCQLEIQSISPNGVVLTTALSNISVYLILSSSISVLLPNESEGKFHVASWFKYSGHLTSNSLERPHIVQLFKALTVVHPFPPCTSALQSASEVALWCETSACLSSLPPTFPQNWYSRSGVLMAENCFSGNSIV